jgi:hypothetical protein
MSPKVQLFQNTSLVGLASRFPRSVVITSVPQKLHRQIRSIFIGTKEVNGEEALCSYARKSGGGFFEVE